MKRFRLVLLLLGALVIGAGTALVLMPPPAQAEGRSSTPLATTGADVREASFGDLAADALRGASKANVALVAAISFKPGALVAGSLSLPRVSSLLANPDEVWAVSKLSGSALRGALEYAVHSAPLPSTSFLQVSGLTFVYDPNAPRSKRVSNIRVGEDDLRDDGTYRVAMPLSLAKGGSGYFKYFPKDSLGPPSQQSLAAAIVQFAGASSDPVSYTGTGRVTRQ